MNRPGKVGFRVRASKKKVGIIISYTYLDIYIYLLWSRIRRMKTTTRTRMIKRRVARPKRHPSNKKARGRLMKLTRPRSQPLKRPKRVPKLVQRRPRQIRLNQRTAKSPR